MKLDAKRLETITKSIIAYGETKKIFNTLLQRDAEQCRRILQVKTDLYDRESGIDLMINDGLVNMYHLRSSSDLRVDGIPVVLKEINSRTENEQSLVELGAAVSSKVNRTFVKAENNTVVVEEMTMEVLSSSIFINAISRRITPHIINVYDTAFCMSSKSKMMKSYVLMQRSNVSFMDYLKKSTDYLSYQAIMRFVFQLTHGMMRMFNEYSYYHFDLHVGNVYLTNIEKVKLKYGGKRISSASHFRYEWGAGKKIVIDNCGWLPQIIDLGQAAFVDPLTSVRYRTGGDAYLVGDMSRRVYFGKTINATFFYFILGVVFYMMILSKDDSYSAKQKRIYSDISNRMILYLDGILEKKISTRKDNFGGKNIPFLDNFDRIVAKNKTSKRRSVLFSQRWINMPEITYERILDSLHAELEKPKYKVETVMDFREV